MKTQVPYVLARKSAFSTHFELADKLLAHTMGWQHYAFSIFIFNASGELLLQKRAMEKYHSPGLWTNTCCSHPLSAQLPEVQSMAKERLEDEMGIMCDLKHIFRFEYRVRCGELIENEIDDVFVGFSNDLPTINTGEVSDYRYVRLEELRRDVETKPAEYTEWLKIIIQSHYDTLHRAASK